MIPRCIIHDVGARARTRPDHTVASEERSAEPVGKSLEAVPIIRVCATRVLCSAVHRSCGCPDSFSDSRRPLHTNQGLAGDYRPWFTTKVKLEGS